MCSLKNNYGPTFSPKISPNKEVDACCKHYKCTIIECKPLVGLRNATHGGGDEDKKIIDVWEDCVKSAFSSGEIPPDFLQREMYVHLLSWKLEAHETEDDIVRNRVINDGENEDSGEDDDDWMEEKIANYVAYQDFDKVTKDQMR